MKRSLKVNAIYNIIYQVISILLPLITAPYASRVLGATGIGNISYTQAIFVYFNLLATMGTGTYAQRLIASEQEYSQRMSKSFWEIVILKLLLTLFSGVLYATYIINWGGDLRFLLSVQFVDLFINIVDIAWLYQGMEDFQKTVSRQVVIRVVGAALIFVFVKNPGDEYKYLLCNSVPTIIGYATMWSDVRKVGISLVKTKLHPFLHLKGVIALFIPYIATLLFSYVDRIMIGSMTSTTAEVGYYEQGNKFITISITLITSLSTVLLPKIASLCRNNNFQEVSKYLNKSIRFVLCVGCLLSVGLFIVGENLIPWYFGTDFVASIPIMQILSLLVIVKGINAILGGGYLIASYRQTKYTISIYLSAITNIVLNCILISKFNAIGAAIASVIAEWVLFIFMIAFSRDVLHVKEIIHQIWKYIVSGIVAFGVAYPLSKIFSSSLIHTVLLTVLITGIYGLLLLFLKDEIVLDTLKSILNKVKSSK